MRGFRFWGRGVAALLLLCGGVGRAWGQAVLVGDAHVSSAQPGVNAGGLSNLNVGGGATALVQFDLSPLPAGTTAAQIGRAVLRMYVNRVDTAGVVAVAPVLSAWSEGAVTFATMPTVGAAVQVASVGGAGQFVSFDVTATVQGWVSGVAANDGLALSAGTAVVYFDSKENDLTGHPAELEILLTPGSGGSGAVGATGATGAPGATGPQGLQGVAGAAGAAGAKGATGATGATGLQGSQGVTGATGATGVAGATGAPGLQGAAGTAGVAGSTGANGATGATGATGAAGFVYQGAYQSTANYGLGDVVVWAGGSWVSLHAANHGNTPGTTGDWGALTAQGLQGLMGATGATGATGVQGLPGSVGPPGERGDQGLQGIAGQAGAQGIPGVAGAAGLQGPMGPQGVAGPVGLSFRGAYSSTINYALADGVLWQGAGWVSLVDVNHGNTPDQSPGQWAMFAAQGGVGAAGATGATGAQGLQGLQGLVGATGAMGVTGAMGATGRSLSFLGEYQSGTNYAANDAVTWQGSGWVSLADSNHGNTPDASPGFWGLMVAQGPVGAAGGVGATGATGAVGATGATGASGVQGAPVSFAGLWNAARNYAVGDAVSFGGASYIATAANVNAEPDVATGVWGVLSARGAQGPVGAQGLTGPQGAKGDKGDTGAQGAAGQGGAQGIQGVAGPTGAQGPQGSAGAQGATGAAGATGAQGAAGMNFRGAWNGSTHYAVNDAVVFSGSTYLALASSTNDEPDTDASNWTVVAQAGGAGPTGAAATVSVGTVSTLAAGAMATVTNVGTANAAVLNFGVPQGAAGATGAQGAAGSGGGGGGTTASGSSFSAMYHSVSFSTSFYAVNTPNAAASETAAVLAFVPKGCAATRLDVYSQQSNNVTVTLRMAAAGSALADTTLKCTTAVGSCTLTLATPVTVAAGSMIDFSISGASGTPAGVWTALECD